VLPLQFKPATRGKRSPSTAETFDIEIGGALRPKQDATLVVNANGDATRRIPLVLRIDTAIEVDYYRHGGILPFVLRQLLAA
jgi:aconitate hydratase